ncbi:hypothetical protein Cylst_1624 [Cylindrospermum stagnale PCC 7417]|uniref:Uncharacterized protein n=1 Tax=Cylindrospermum stagnale PCC 7417 TaxID=56107 RepID=K9WWJ5_9NOST|nr:hypothetical protein [Cylindrospermum stagnale]AFZ23902.1 hypothetical protein Cylst_1624 [Cylindrospermum stagnale PCC 7417]
MSQKQHPIVRKIWPQLRELISPIPENNFDELLASLKNWICHHQILLQNLNSECAALSLLLEDKTSQFPMVKLTAGAYLKSQINSDIYPPKDIKDIIERLEIIVREFALFTKWERCPICNEGYLQYWKDTNINEIVLSCPECGWEQYLNEQNVAEDNLRLSILVPASKEDMKEYILP